MIISEERVWPVRAQARAPAFRWRATGALALPIGQHHGKEVSHVYQHPYMASQLIEQRHRELMALGAERHRARKRAALARASRRAERAERRMRRAARKALRLRAELGQ